VQYKQCLRILGEIIEIPGVPIQIVFAAARMFSKNPLPKLGPYPKRSLAQVLWRMASDATLSPEARWMALRKLLAIRLCTEPQL
jgi:hypothetical protein